MILLERLGAAYGRHSLQVNLREHISKKDYFFEQLQRLLPEDALYYEPKPAVRASGSPWELVPRQGPVDEYGREDEPHVTILYGLIDASSLFDIMRFARTVEPFEVELGPISFFSEPDRPYDVMKVDICSPHLHILNEWVRQNCPVELTFPEYRPHMTLGYVVRGAMPPDAMGHRHIGKRILVEALKFSHTDGFKIRVPLKEYIGAGDRPGWS